MLNDIVTYVMRIYYCVKETGFLVKKRKTRIFIKCTQAPAYAPGHADYLSSDVFPSSPKRVRRRPTPSERNGKTGKTSPFDETTGRDASPRPRHRGSTVSQPLSSEVTGHQPASHETSSRVDPNLDVGGTHLDSDWSRTQVVRVRRNKHTKTYLSPSSGSGRERRERRHGVPVPTLLPSRVRPEPRRDRLPGVSRLLRSVEEVRVQEPESGCPKHV